MAMPKTKYDFDAVDELQKVGFSQDQGRAMVRIFHEMQTAELATKADLVETRETLRTEIAETRETLRTEIAETRETLRTEMAVRIAAAETKLIKWMIGTALGSVALVTAILGIVIPQLIK